jgi:predicted anti-sigma-YlaC factor YlaD
LSGPHLEPSLLEAFLQGQVDETAAIGIAEHLDDCSSCRQMASSMDDLHHQLVSSEPEGAMPDDLPAAIWEAHTTRPTAGRWPVLGMAMLAATGLVVAMVGSALGPAADPASIGQGVSVVVADPLHPMLPGAWVSGVAAAALVLIWGVRTRH